MRKFISCAVAILIGERKNSNKGRTPSYFKFFLIFSIQLCCAVLDIIRTQYPDFYPTELLHAYPFLQYPALRYISIYVSYLFIYLSIYLSIYVSIYL